MRLRAFVLAAALSWQASAYAAPRDEAALLHARAVEAIARGDDREALRQLEQAYLLWSVPTTLMDLAEVHVRLGQTEQALAALRIIVDSKEDDPSAADLVEHARLRIAVLEHPSHPATFDVITPAPSGPAPSGRSPIPPIDETPAPDTVRAPHVEAFEEEPRVPVVPPIDEYRLPRPSGAALTVPVQAPKVKRSKFDKAMIALAVIGGAAGFTLVFTPLIYFATRTPPTATLSAGLIAR
jgi:hypothetical protein